MRGLPVLYFPGEQCYLPTLSRPVSLRTQTFDVDGGRAVATWIEFDPADSFCDLRVALASHPRGTEDLLMVADSLRRIAAAGLGSVRGSVTADDVLVISRSSTEGRLGIRSIRAGNSDLIGRDAIEFTTIARMVSEGRLVMTSSVEPSVFQPRDGSPLEAEVLRGLREEGRMVYSVRSAGPERGRQVDVAVRPTLPIGYCAHYQTLPEICASLSRAKGGINGGFFANFEEELSIHTVFNDPVGLLMIDGDIIFPPSFRRGTVLVLDDGSIQISTVDMSVVAFEMGGQRFSGMKYSGMGDGIPFDINQESPDGIALYNCSYGPRSPEGNVLEIVVAGASAVEVGRGGNSVIPQSGFNFQLPEGPEADKLISKLSSSRESNRVRYELNLPEVEKKIVHGMSAGPILLKDGRMLRADNSEALHSAEEFTPGRIVPTRLKLGIADSKARAARSALGITGGGEVLLLTVDDDRRADLPPKQRHSVGATLHELARAMKELGCEEALNLDGGGSSTLWFEGDVRNRPADGFARAIPTALAVIARG